MNNPSSSTNAMIAIVARRTSGSSGQVTFRISAITAW